MATNDAKKQLSNNNLIIVMVLITLMVLGVAGLVTKALVSSVVRDTKVISAKSKADKQLKSDLTAAPQLVDAYNALGSTANILNDALPTTEDLPSLIVTLENMGNDAGIAVKSVSPSQANTGGTPAPAASTAAPAAPATTTTGTTPTSLPSTSAASGGIAMVSPQPYDFAIEFDGSYPALQKFLSDVETSARPMRVTGIQLNGTGSSLTGEVDMETYWQDKAQLPFGTEKIK